MKGLGLASFVREILLGKARRPGHLDVAYFQTFENRYLMGRSLLLCYLHLHDLFKAGKELVLDLPHASHRSLSEIS